ncbi:hypothetical protein BB560_003125 [Smittium megazygosporum]|uniref:Peregrin n=1 Tax=Smittium megazygosporum TaxID=133381 RepID=A0A2T9ZCZ6_9FUNG|nr:hypothetical protein BB560_003125 [Smittium megazygosporum]
MLSAESENHHVNKSLSLASRMSNRESKNTPQQAADFEPKKLSRSISESGKIEGLSKFKTKAFISLPQKSSINQKAFSAFASAKSSLLCLKSKLTSEDIVSLSQASSCLVSSPSNLSLEITSNNISSSVFVDSSISSISLFSEQGSKNQALEISSESLDSQLFSQTANSSSKYFPLLIDSTLATSHSDPTIVITSSLIHQTTSKTTNHHRAVPESKAKLAEYSQKNAHVVTNPLNSVSPSISPNNATPPDTQKRKRGRPRKYVESPQPKKSPTITKSVDVPSSLPKKSRPDPKKDNSDVRMKLRQSSTTNPVSYTSYYLKINKSSKEASLKPPANRSSPNSFCKSQKTDNILPSSPDLHMQHEPKSNSIKAQDIIKNVPSAIASTSSSVLSTKNTDSPTPNTPKNSTSRQLKESIEPDTINSPNQVKPREERHWEEFFPDLDLDHPIIFKCTSMPQNDNLKGFCDNKITHESPGKPEFDSSTELKLEPNNPIKLGTLSNDKKFNAQLSNNLLDSDSPALPPFTGTAKSTPHKSMGKVCKNNLKRSKVPSRILSIKNPFISLPKPKYTQVEPEFKSNVVNVPKNHYIRYIPLTEPEKASTVEYDLDDLDFEWLNIISSNMINTGIKISESLFESLIDFLEKSWFDLTRDIQSQISLKNLEQLSAEDAACNICEEEECDNSNAIVFCDGCNLAVHQDCYGVPYIPEGQWLCRKCMLSPGKDIRCIFCPHKGGAFKKTTDNEWAHLLCALWIPEVGISNTVYMEPIDSVDMIPKSRWKLICSLCGIRTGACIQCSNKSCFTAFHVTCAFKARIYMKMKLASSSQSSSFDVFCTRHTPKDYQKVIDIEVPKEILKNTKSNFKKEVPKDNIPFNKLLATLKSLRSNSFYNSICDSTPLQAPVKRPLGRPKKNKTLSPTKNVASSSSSSQATLSDPYFPSSPKKDSPSYKFNKSSIKIEVCPPTNSQAFVENSGIFQEDLLSPSEISLIATCQVFSINSPIVNEYMFSKVMVFLESSGRCNSFNKLKLHWIEFAKSVCKYWSLKRRLRNGAPLSRKFFMEPWTPQSSITSISTSELSPDQIIETYESLSHLKQIVGLVLEREKLKTLIAKRVVDSITNIIYPLKDCYLQILDTLDRKDRNNVFSKPVDPEDAPFYYKVIKNPMDLGTIRRKVVSFQYNSINEFESDLNLVWANCIKYNEDKSYHNNLARRLSAACKDLMSELYQQAHYYRLSLSEYSTLLHASAIALDKVNLKLGKENSSNTSNSEPASPPLEDSGSAGGLLDENGLQIARKRLLENWGQVLETGFSSKDTDLDYGLIDRKFVLENVYKELFPIIIHVPSNPMKKRKITPQNENPSSNSGTKFKSTSGGNSSAKHTNIKNKKSSSKTRVSDPKETPKSLDSINIRTRSNSKFQKLTRLEKHTHTASVLKKKASKGGKSSGSKVSMSTSNNPEINKRKLRPLSAISYITKLTGPSALKRKTTKSVQAAKPSSSKTRELNKSDGSIRNKRKALLPASGESSITNKPNMTINDNTHFYKPKSKTIDGKFIIKDDSPAIFCIPIVKWPVGTLVWASMPSFPWYPAEIYNPKAKNIPKAVENDRAKNPEKNTVLVYFFDIQLSHRTWKWLSPYRILKLGVDKELDEQLLRARTARSSFTKKQILAAYDAALKASKK